MAASMPKFDHRHPEEWDVFLDSFLLWLDACNAISDQQKRGMLSTALDAQTLRNLREWIHPVQNIRDKTFTQLITVLATHIKPAVNNIVEFNNLVCRKQQPGELASDFLACLRVKADAIGLGDMRDKILLWRFVVGLSDHEVQSQLLGRHETLTLRNAEDLVKTKEESCQQQKKIHVQAPDQVHWVRTRNSNSKSVQSTSGAPSVCFHCGDTDHVAPACSKDWRAFFCILCKKPGHLKKVCKARKAAKASRSNPTPTNSKFQQRFKSGNKPPVAHKLAVSEEDLDEEDEEQLSVVADEDYDSDQLYYLHSMPAADDSCDLHLLKTFDQPAAYLTVCVNGTPIKFEVDNGATRTIIGLSTYESLLSISVPQLQPYNSLLTPWGEGSPSLSVKGWCMVSVVHAGQSYQLPLMVAATNGLSLLGRNWFLTLGIEILGVNYVNTCSPTVNVPSTPANETEFQQLIRTLPAVSGRGTGCYKGSPIHLDLAASVPPAYHRARTVPFALTTRMHQAIDANVARGVWEPLVQAGPWATAIVPVLKKNGTLRLCADYKGTVNRALSSDTYRSPTTDEVLAKLSGGKIYAQLDLEEAYTQLPVDEVTSKVLAVNTVKGLFRVVRLPYGIKVAPPAFQRVVDHVLVGVPGVIAYQDNIYLQAQDEASLRNKLILVLQLLGDAGLKVNASKCTWQASSMEVLGFHLDADGVHPLPDKAAAIRSASPPADKQQLQSLLGVISFYGRFFKNKATILEPLHRLLHADVPFHWTAKQDKALQLVKDMLSSDRVLVHYETTRPVVLTCDASPVGVGAVLSHIFQVQGSTKTVEKPIMFASRTLTDTERRYAQLDKEALAIIFGVKKYAQYLVGRAFTIVTDHKPLLGIFRPGRSTSDHLSPRMLRWTLHLGAMDYTLEHRPGTSIAHADFLSRFPVSASTLNTDTPCDVFLLEARDVIGLSSSIISAATLADPLLAKVITWTQKGWPLTVEEEFKPYFQKREALSVMNDCLLWKTRVVIPEALRSQVLKLVHATHLGEYYSKATARAIVWWPKIDEDVVATVKLCVQCQLTAPSPPVHHISPWPSPSGPWERIHIDYFGPFHGHNFLLVVDAYSGWVNVKVVSTLTAAELIRHMRYMFADYGLPAVIVTDNGRQLVSEEFDFFLSSNGVKHLTTPPWHPASNGLAERTVRSVKNQFKKFVDGDVHARLARVLWALHTAPSQKGKTPAELLGRPLHTHLTAMHPASKQQLDIAPASWELLHPGQLVWVLKHRLHSKSWVPAMVIHTHGSRVYDVRLDSGLIMSKVSADHLRPRFTQDQEPNIFEDAADFTEELPFLPAQEMAFSNTFPPALGPLAVHSPLAGISDGQDQPSERQSAPPGGRSEVSGLQLSSPLTAVDNTAVQATSCQENAVSTQPDNLEVQTSPDTSLPAVPPVSSSPTVTRSGRISKPPFKPDEHFF